MSQNIKYILLILLFDSLVPESARWLAVHGREHAQKTWKRLLPCNQRDVSNDTDSIKMITDELKCAGYGTGNSSENEVTRNQQPVNIDITQVDINNIPVDRAVFEYSNTRIQLPVEEEKACKRIMKQEVVKDKLKDCSGWCDNSSISTEHLGILPNHISNIENRSYGNVCKKDGCDSNESQNTHYPEASDSTVEISYSLSCNTMNDCKEHIDGTHRMDKKERKLINVEEISDVTLMHNNSKISSSSTMESDFNKEFEIELLCKESKGMLHGSLLDRIKSQKDVSVDTNEHNSISFCRSICRNESDGPNYICTEATQDLKSDDETSVCAQSTSVINDKTITQDDRDERLCIVRTFAENYKKMGDGEARSTYRKIALGEEYGMVHQNEIGGINSIVPEFNETSSDTVGVVTVNTSGKDVNHDDGLIWNNMPKKYKITEHRTATEPKTLDSTTTKIGIIELFRSSVLRKYNLTMVFVW
jgi:hypothetical protein